MDGGNLYGVPLEKRPHMGVEGGLRVKRVLFYGSLRLPATTLVPDIAALLATEEVVVLRPSRGFKAAKGFDSPLLVSG